MWIKIALQEMTPVALVAFRVLFGLIYSTAVIVIKRVEIPWDVKTWRTLLLLGFTNIAAPFLLISWGQKYISSSEAAILDSTVPLFTIFLAHYFLKDDKMTPQKLFGLLIGFGGVIVLLSKDIDGSGSTILGQAAVVLACIFYAGSGVYIRRNTVDTPSALRSAGPLLSASLIMWTLGLSSGGGITVPSSGITWIALLFLGVVGSGIALTMAFYLIHEIGPTRTSMVTYMFPLGGVLLGVIFLDEQITWQLVMGGMLIIASLVVANKKKSTALDFNSIQVQRTS